MVALHWPIAEPFEIVIGSEKRKKNGPEHYVFTML